MSGATPSLEGHTLTVDGTEVLVQGAGDDTLLMLHGWPDTLALWDGTVAALADRYRCARLTLPGFDCRQPPLPRAPTLAQMTAHLLAVVDRLSPDRPLTLMVHDWGCLFGYELALRHPGRVARVVGVDVGDHNSTRLRQSLRPRQRLGVLGYQLWLAIAWQLGRLGARRLADGMTRRMARGVRCPSNLSVVHSGMNYPYAMRWFGTSGGLAGALPVALPMPMLFVYGRRKPFMFQSPEWLAELQARPGCAVLGLPCGHWVMTAQPQAFNTAVRAWLDGAALPST